MNRLRRIFQTFGDTRGGAAVPFLIAFPIFLWIVGILVQYALIVNAKEMLDNAAQQAARAAVTSLPEGKPDNVRNAAYMALVPLSPQAKVAPTAEASNVSQALHAMGVNVPESFAKRFTYATNATQVSWDPAIDYTQSPGRVLTMKVNYRFYLTVPGAQRLVGDSDSIAGIEGHFITLSSTCQAQTSHSRAAFTDGSGWPQ